MKTLLLSITVLVLASACQPDPEDIKLYDELVVSTNYDPSATFDSYQTYAMSTDTIGFVSNQTRDTILTNTDSDLVRPTLTRIRENLTNAGYQEIDRKDSPDLGINVLIVNNLNMFQQVVDPGYYYPYSYGYSSYYYYPYVQTYTQNTGTLIIQVIDLKNRNTNNEARVVWNAYMGDIITAVNRLKQIQQGIDQAFVQSPYIRRDL